MSTPTVALARGSRGMIGLWHAIAVPLLLIIVWQIWASGLGPGARAPSPTNVEIGRAHV